ncbi:MAG: acyl-CoA thioesterase [Pedosphaera parvula]|nr:acyl-CoA thioesterase [Pedosphaera parvula]
MTPDAKEFSQFETELPVRPSDIDLNGHVHNSHYFDYVLAARYDQMARCYGMSMDEFLRQGYGWVVRTAHLDFKRPVGMGDRVLVRTRVTEIVKDSVRVEFEILRVATRKVACDGWFLYTMVSTQTGKATAIPDWIVKKYSI